jgi:hypothetical protein
MAERSCAPLFFYTTEAAPLPRRGAGLRYYANINEISFVDYDLDVIREGRSPARIVDGEEVRVLINRAPRYQEDALITAFDLIDRGEQKFLSRWTEDRELP